MALRRTATGSGLRTLKKRHHHRKRRVAHQTAAVVHHRGFTHELPRDCVVVEPIAVAEGNQAIPDRLIDGDPHGPAERQLALRRLDQKHAPEIHQNACSLRARSSLSGAIGARHVCRSSAESKLFFRAEASSAYRTGNGCRERNPPSSGSRTGSGSQIEPAAIGQLVFLALGLGFADRGLGQRHWGQLHQTRGQLPPKLFPDCKSPHGTHADAKKAGTLDFEGCFGFSGMFGTGFWVVMDSNHRPAD
jgi:hypothetical protein